jgi:anaerobic magnesium-protoporphyrin IX monomethyl ester cyclase
MKKIVFTHSYFLRFDPKQWKTGQPYAPLGTLYAAALMRDKGYDVFVHDIMFAKGPSEISASLNRIHPDFFVIYDDGFNYLTKMCLTNMREAAFEMIRMAKENGCRVLVSSSDSTDHFEKYLDAGADFVMLGEAEVTLMELCKTIENNGDLSSIAGIAYKTGNAVLKTIKRQVIKDLDSLPMPAWDLIDIEPYREMWQKNKGYFSINIGTTRGCPFKCNWCAKPIYGNRYNARSPENVLQELLWLKKNIGFDHVWFCDDIFGLRPGWVNQFADLIENAELRFRFKIQSRADLLVQENYVEALARAGCDNVWMGAESGSQKILDAMDKGTTIQQIRDATHLLKKNQIKPSFFIQFGYLGETREDIAMTIKLIRELLPYEIGISVSYPLPGTVFYEKVKEQLKTKSNWSDSDELALMFHSTFPSSFYKQLHRYVHRNYRKQLALKNFQIIFRQPGKVSLDTLKKAVSGIFLIPASFISELKLRQLEKTR